MAGALRACSVRCGVDQEPDGAAVLVGASDAGAADFEVGAGAWVEAGALEDDGAGAAVDDEAEIDPVEELVDDLAAGAAEVEASVPQQPGGVSR